MANSINLETGEMGSEFQESMRKLWRPELIDRRQSKSQDSGRNDRPCAIRNAVRVQQEKDGANRRAV